MPKAPAPPAAPQVDDDGWDEGNTEDSTTLVGSPRGATAAHVDVPAIARAAVDQALVPIFRALGDLDRRIEALERLAAAARAQAPAPAPAPAPARAVVPIPVAAPVPAGVAVPAPVLAPAPAPAPAFVAAPAFAPAPPFALAPVHTPEPPPARDPYVSAIAAPGQPISRAPQPSLAPLLDVAAINRDISLDYSPFDSGRRRRRLVLALTVALIIVFGGLGYMLAQSYAPPH
jgi:ribonuclease E